MKQLSIRRIQAIFIKDFWEFSRNYAISIMIFMPIIVAIIFQDRVPDVQYLSIFIMSMTYGIVTSFIQASVIAEEKERNTLRGLLLSPASLLDILIGKALLVSVITFVTLAICFIIIGFVPTFSHGIGIILCTMIFCALGLVCGLFANSVMEATYTTLPVLFVFAFTPITTTLANDFPMMKTFEWFPISLLQEMIYHDQLLVPFLILILWFVITWTIALYLCQRRMTD